MQNNTEVETLVVEIAVYARFRAKWVLDPVTGCWVWLAGTTGKSKTSKGGYAHFTVKGKFTYGHRYAYEVFVGPIPKGMDLDHKCRNRACVNPDHLEPVSRKENARRGLTGHGRHLRGEQAGGSKLTAAQVRAIRKAYASGEFTQKELGLKYSVMHTTISDITRGKTWTHLKAA